MAPTLDGVSLFQALALSKWTMKIVDVGEVDGQLAVAEPPKREWWVGKRKLVDGRRDAGAGLRDQHRCKYEQP